MSFKLVIADKGKPWDAIYTTEDGRPLFRAASADFTPRNSVGTVTFSKIHSAQDIQDTKIGFKQKLLGGLGSSSGPGSGSSKANFASFRLRSFHSDEITVHGVTITAKEMFEKPMGLRWYGRDRVWKGPDGQEYRWEMGSSKPELFRNVDNKKDALVAKYHRAHSGFIQDKTPANLEIFGQVSEQMVEMILITFVYMEALRAAREKATASAAGDVGGAVGDAGAAVAV